VQAFYSGIYRLQQPSECLQLQGVCIHLRLVTRLLSKTQKVSLLRADISYKVALGVDVLQMQVFQIEAARNNLHRSEVMTSSNLVAVVRLGSTVLKKKVAGSTDKA